MPDRLRLDIHDESDMALRRWFYAHGPLAAIARAAGMNKAVFHAFVNGIRSISGEQYDLLLEAAGARPERTSDERARRALAEAIFLLGMDYADLESTRRCEHARRRAYLYWLMREATGLSYLKVARLCRQNTHTGAHVGWLQFTARLAMDATLRAEAMGMLDKVKEAMR